MLCSWTSQWAPQRRSIRRSFWTARPVVVQHPWLLGCTGMLLFKVFPVRWRSPPPQWGMWPPVCWRSTMWLWPTLVSTPVVPRTTLKLTPVLLVSQCDVSWYVVWAELRTSMGHVCLCCLAMDVIFYYLSVLLITFMLCIRFPPRIRHWVKFSLGITEYSSHFKFCLVS